jgi:ABC-type antimicrobial peptide transport system permease subunit
MSYTVAQRTREIGVRMALGARRTNVLALVAREGATLVGAGVALGVIGALAVTRVLGGMLFEVSPTDPVALTIAALLLAAAPSLRRWFLSGGRCVWIQWSSSKTNRLLLVLGIRRCSLIPSCRA